MKNQSSVKIQLKTETGKPYLGVIKKEKTQLVKRKKTLLKFDFFNQVNNKL